MFMFSYVYCMCRYACKMSGGMFSRGSTARTPEQVSQGKPNESRFENRFPTSEQPPAIDVAGNNFSEHQLGIRSMPPTHPQNNSIFLNNKHNKPKVQTQTHDKANNIISYRLLPRRGRVGAPAGSGGGRAVPSKTPRNPFILLSVVLFILSLSLLLLLLSLSLQLPTDPAKLIRKASLGRQRLAPAPRDPRAPRGWLVFSPIAKPIHTHSS